ncbi:hypothetical protein [Pantoea agglomerans]|uniref:hypothetical protein n=1 Tax=Enterobacter agglomerans TaxID=549 RepID=UPI0013CD192B|nr:hypothetical protein [Pantoea agglomerans]NEG82923.1 hypothetical protein [Pantoea agglomerans]
MIGVFFSVLKDIVLTLTAITGAYVALKGLSTWKRQISGQANYSLSKSLLVNLYKYRDIISSIRHPAMSGRELNQSAPDEIANMNESQARFHNTHKAYEARWKRISEIRPEIYANITEAEALWGVEIVNLWDDVTKKENDLLIALRDYLEYLNPDIDRSDKEYLRGEHRNVRRIVFEGGDDDPFKTDFDLKLNEITKYIKKKIKT